MTTKLRQITWPSAIFADLKALGVLFISEDRDAILDGYGTVVAAITATPSISPNGDEGGGPIEVTLACATPDADIYYTTDGSAPNALDTKYTVPFNVTETGTVKAVAIAPGQLKSAEASADFVINGDVATPTFDPAAGEVAADTEVAIATTTPGAAIYYTTNGDTPTTASTLYTGPVVVAEAMTIKAIAVKPLFNDSAVASAAYTIAP